MAKTTVFLRDCRIAFPALDEPKAQMMGGDPKYEVTALMPPDSEACKQLKAAVIQVAREGFGQQADRMLATPGFSPVRSGDDREKIPAGYAGMVYVTAKNQQRIKAEVDEHRNDPRNHRHNCLSRLAERAGIAL